MIKRYNQFVKGKTNEDFTFADPAVKPATPEVLPGIEERPTPPSIIPDEQQSDLPAPAKAELPEEEGGEYIGQKMMSELAQALGVDIESDGSVNYDGQKINFFSETEKFHIGREKFDTVDAVINYLEKTNKPTETTDRLSDVDEDEYERGDISFESKSYKRRFTKK